MNTATIIAISLLIGGVLWQVIVSVASNLITDPTKEFIAKQSLVNKRKKVASLESELDYISYLHDNGIKFYCEIAKNTLQLGRLIFLFFIALASIAFLMFIPTTDQNRFVWGISFILAILLLLLSSILLVIQFRRLNKFIDKIRYFDDYTKQMKTRITKLEIRG